MPSEAERFLSCVYAASTATATLWRGPRHLLAGWSPGEDIAPAAALVTEAAPADDVYIRVGTTDGVPERGRGTEADTVEVPALWADLDVAGGEHGERELPTLDAALSAVEAFGAEVAPATLVVHSGGGLHVWWVLGTPLPGGPEAKALVAGLQAWFRARLAPAEVDRTHDLARLLRVPGTLNHKTDPPKPVYVVDEHSTWAPVPAERFGALRGTTAAPALPSGDPPTADVAVPWGALGTPAAALLAEEPPQGQRSEHAYALVAELRAEGWTASEALALLMSEHGPERAHERGERATWVDVQRIFAKLDADGTPLSTAGARRREQASKRAETQRDQALERIERQREQAAKRAAREDEQAAKRAAAEAKALASLAELRQHAEHGRRRAQEAGELIPAGTAVPDPWQLGRDGVWMRTDDGRTTPVVATPLVVTEILQGQLGDEHLTVQWDDAGRRRSTTVPREDLADSRALVRVLARHGVPVDSTRALHVVRWLNDFVTANRGSLPRSTVTGHLGWHGAGFVLPAESIGCEHVFAADAGAEQLARAVAPSGTLTGWADAVAPAAAYPGAVLAVYAALAAPLLHVVGAPNFVVEWAGPTSRGKSTALRLAASVWGDHDERAGGLLLTWDATRVAIERSAALLSDVPLIVDETQRARSLPEAAQVVYDLASGRGRGRGSIEGLAATSHSRSVVLTSGEQSLTSTERAGGLARRLVPLWGSPFGEASVEVGTLAVRVAEALRAEHGTAGPAFVRALVGQDRAALAARYAAHAEALRADALAGADPGLLVGLSQAVAVLRLAGELAHELLPLPWAWDDPTVGLWATLIADTAQEDRPRDALRAVVSWAGVRRSAFASQTGGDYAPPGGWLGRWDSGGELCLTAGALKAALAEAGYGQAAAMARQWRDAGWLAEGRGRTHRSVRIGGAVVSCVCVTAAEVAAVMGEG